MPSAEPRPPVVAALIPAHDEAATVRAVAEGALAHADAVVVIDDGSRDGTAERLAGLPVRVIRHQENLGKGARLVEGLELAFAEGADHVLTLDADGQHDPEDIPAFRARAEQGAFVLGDRSGDRAEMPAARRRANDFGSFFITWACAQEVRDAQCGMRLYSRDGWRRTRMSRRAARGFVFETAVLMHASEAGVRFHSVPIAARYGKVTRPSHFRPLRDFAAIFGAVAGFLATRGFRPTGLLTALRTLR